MKEYNNLVSYLPNVVAKFVEERNETEQPPYKQNFDHSVCLFADVSGFTNLTEGLAKHGSQGIEELATQLNRFVGIMVRLTARAGGDVLKFAGDALMAFWPPVPGEDYSVSIQRAIHCALDMQQQLDKYEFNVYRKNNDYKEIRQVHIDSKKPDPNLLFSGTLRVKLGIGYGPITIIHLGGSSDNVMKERYEYVALGPGLDEAFLCEKHTEPGQVVVSAAVENLVSAGTKFKFVDVHEKKCYQVVVGEGVNGKARPAVPAQNVKWRNVNIGNKASDVVPDVSIGRFWKYVPVAVMPYLQQSNEFWAPELRRVTTLFCSLDLQDEVSNLQVSSKYKQALDVFQTVISRVQSAVFRYQGTINKFLVDDKGSTIIAVFGLPPFAHENDATRGVLAASSILGALDEVKIRGHIGITTAVAFCGVVGHRGNRREYSVLGDSVNLAARLMQFSKYKKRGILIDAHTVDAAQNDLRFTVYGDIQVKGKHGKIKVYEVSFDYSNSSKSNYDSLQLARIRNNMHGAQTQKLLQSRQNLRITRSVEMNQVRDLSNNSELSNVRQRYNEKQSEINAESAWKVKEHNEKLANGLERFEESRRGSGTKPGRRTSKRPSATSHRYRTSTTSHSQHRASTTSHKPKRHSKVPQHADSHARKLKYKAARIRFDNCATSTDGKSNIAQGTLVTNYTISLKDNIVKMKDVKKEALRWLRGRQLLRNPGIGLEYFELRWADTSDESIVDEDLNLKDLRRESPILEFLIVERETPVHLVGASTPGNSVPKQKLPLNPGFSLSVQENTFGTDSRAAIRARLLAKRNALISGISGGIVVLTGMNGVGKTKLMSDVLFATGTNTQVAVSAGNPFETESLARPFGVWSIIAKQLIEEKLTRMGAKQQASEMAMLTLEVEQLITKAIQDAYSGTMGGFDEQDLPLLNPILGTRFQARETDIIPETASTNQPTQLSRTNSEQRKQLKLSQRFFSSGRKSERRSKQRGLRISHESSRLKRSLSPNTKLTQSKLDESRTVRLLSSLIIGLSKRTPTIVIIDDCHFMDILSWELAVDIAEFWANAQILVVFAHRSKYGLELAPKTVAKTRPISVVTAQNRHNVRAHVFNLGRNVKEREAIKFLFEKLMNNPMTTKLDMVPNPSLTGELIRDILSVNSVPEELVTHLAERSHGNPMYITDTLKLYKKQKLIEIKNNECKLTNEKKFEMLERLHKLPIASTVAGACASEIDSLSTAQQLALKTAAMIGPTFTFDNVETVFPIKGLLENLTKEWGELVDFGIICKKDDNRKVPQYCFHTMWMADTVYQRMLSKQKRKLHEVVVTLKKRAETNTKDNFMKNFKGSAGYKGWALVRKDHARNMLKPWKRRWLVLQGNELIQYYDQSNPKRLEVIKLSDDNIADVREEGGVYESKKGVPEFCFVIQARSWTKKGRERDDEREFYMAVETKKVLTDWVFYIDYNIRFFNNRVVVEMHDMQKDDKSEKDEKKSNALMANAAPYMSSKVKSVVPQAFMVGGSHELPSRSNERLTNGEMMNDSQKMVPPPPPPPLSNVEAGGGHVPQPIPEGISVRSKKHGRPSVRSPNALQRSGFLVLTRRVSKSIIDRFHNDKPKKKKSANESNMKVAIKGSSYPGESIVAMTESDFDEISNVEVLSHFWTEEALNDAIALHFREQHHNWYFEKGDLSLVSQNRSGQIDGYLLGCIDSSNGHQGVIHVCAVLASARRNGIATKLYSSFSAQCQERGCAMLRVTLPKDFAPGIAFHKSIGFIQQDDEEMDENEKLVTLFRNVTDSWTANLL